MKETMIQVLQSQMDKCTSEQFWAVASLTAADAFFVTQRKDLASVPPWVALGLLGLGCLYAIRFVIHRHTAYYRLHNFRAELLKDEACAPDVMKERAKPWRYQELSGVIFFVTWLLGGYAACIFVQ